MNVPSPCDVCGNELDGSAVRCPFCGAAREAGLAASPRQTLRTVNLERGLPTVAQALARLRQEIDQGRVQGYRVLLFIHGYGSSGVGGSIRQEVRRLLSHLRENREINDFLPGEHGDRRSGPGRQLVRRFPFLAQHLRAANPGITLVVL